MGRTDLDKHAATDGRDPSTSDLCIRALDYCPPVDLELGEYLGALITADYDLVPDDRWAYREALIDAFRLRRIYPPHVTNLSEESLHPQQEAVQSAARFYMRRRRRFWKLRDGIIEAVRNAFKLLHQPASSTAAFPRVKGLAASGRANARSQNRLQLETVISLREMPPALIRGSSSFSSRDNSLLMLA